MLSEKEIIEVREHLEKAQNPVFFYDNDPDGFCSYILLRKYISRGKGVAVRTHPGVDVGYVRKVAEFNADYIFVLDRPHLGKEFVDEIKGLNLPIVWIDHHQTDGEKYDYENLFIYNPNYSKEKSAEPVTYLIYKITNRKEDMWIALMGCISDHYLPSFAETFGKNYPEFWSNKVKTPFQAYFETGIGRLAQAITFGIKDSVTHVVQLQNFFSNCRSPSEVYVELESSRAFAKKYKEIKNKYDSLVEEAKQNVEDKIVFYAYGGTISISSEISNELCHLFPDKIVVVAYTSGNMSNVSIRGKGVKKMIEKILPDFEGSSGGGHNDAVGLRIKTSDLPRFKETILKIY